MARFVYRPDHPGADDFGMVDASIAGPKFSGGPAPSVISDSMPETRHMADGKHYTSKSQFRQATKAAGCVEIGSETATMLKPRKPVTLDRAARRDAIRRSIYEIKNRVNRY